MMRSRRKSAQLVVEPTQESVSDGGRFEKITHRANIIAVATAGRRRYPGMFFPIADINVTQYSIIEHGHSAKVGQQAN